MAPTSVRLIARSSKLVHGYSSTFATRPSGTQFSRASLMSCRDAKNSFRPCIAPQNAFGDSRQHYSTTTSDCTLATARLSTLSSRWMIYHSTQAQPKQGLFSFRYTQTRLASNQSSDPNEKPKAESTPTSPTTFIAPKILKQALTPHENIYTLPNFLTFTRLLSAPAIGYFILQSQPVAALSLFFYAGVTDLVDGWLARRFNSQTVVGTIIDPMADKTLMTITVICLGLQGHIPLWLAVIILGRDVGLAISACYYRYISLPPPKTFARYWDFSLPSAEVRPTEISKINTLLQLLLIGNAMLLPVLPTAVVDAWNLVGVFEGWQYLVASTTVWSGLSYVFTNDAVKILSQEESRQAERERDEKRKKLG